MHTYGFANNALTARVTMFFLQAMKDPPSGMPLLSGRLPVPFQHGLDMTQVRIECGLGAWLLTPVSRRLRIPKHLHQGLPVNLVLLASLTLAQLLRQHAATYL